MNDSTEIAGHSQQGSAGLNAFIAAVRRKFSRTVAFARGDSGRGFTLGLEADYHPSQACRRLQTAAEGQRQRNCREAQQSQNGARDVAPRERGIAE